jgi:hypothetical protein
MINRHKSESPAHCVSNVRVDPPHSAAVHVVGEPTEDTYLALMEQAFEMWAGPDAVAKFLANELRKKSTSRNVIAMVARMLDPEVKDYLKLSVVRRRNGKTWKRPANDAALAKWVTKYEQALGNKRGSRKVAVGAAADGFRVSEATVRATVRAALRNSK